MQTGTSKKVFIVILIVLILSLIGVSIFIASKINETQAPSDSSANTVIGCQWCEGYGDQTGACPNPAQKNSPYCNSGGQLNNCCIFQYGSDNNNPPPTNNKKQGDRCTVGQTDPAKGGCDGSGPLNCVPFACNGGSPSGGVCWPGTAGQSFVQWVNTNICSSGAGARCTNPDGNYSQVNCDSTCGSGKGRVCQADGTWSACVNADACGFTGNKPPGADCIYDSECSSGFCAKSINKCADNVSNACSNFPGYSINSFLGCGDVVAGGDGNACHNCFAKDGAGNSCTVWCDPNSVLSCGAKIGCNIQTQKKYSCSGNSCVEDANGTYTTSNCNNQCTPPVNQPPGTNPPPSTPKYKCVNNACVQATDGTYTSSNCDNACAPVSTSATVTVASACPTGSTSPNATVTWSPATPLPTEIQIDTDNNWSNGYYRKTSLSGSSTTAPSGFTGTAGASGSLTLTSSATYYVRAYYQSTNSYSNIATFSAAQCQLTSQAQCVDLVETGSDPLATGTGNFVVYKLVYENSATTDPYPNIRLRVGTSGSPVGRDANNTSSSLVRPYSVTRDSVTNRYTYLFRWEAASTAGANVSAGTYNVRVLLDGTTDLNTPSACTETLTLSQSAAAEPLFTILKQGAPVCEADGDFVVNYTITVTNIGSVSGTIDFVQDTYDAQAYSLGILPTNVNPSYGVVNTGKITWTGDNAQRTFTAGQAKTYTYSIRVPKDSTTTFATTGLYNQALVQYDTSTTNNNTASFDLRTFLSCTIIPATGIIDDYKFILVGILFIILGLIAFRFKIGNQLSLIVLEKTSETFNKHTENLVKKIMPYEESIMDEMEKKREE